MQAIYSHVGSSQAERGIELWYSTIVGYFEGIWGCYKAIKRQKIAKNLANLTVKLYLKQYSSHLFIRGLVPGWTGHRTMIFNYRSALWGHLGALQSHQKTKNLANLTVKLYLKQYSSHLFIRGLVPGWTRHRTMIFNYRSALWGHLGALQRHQKAKNRKKSRKPDCKVISQAVFKTSIHTWARHRLNGA